ncbi:MAG TPA: class I SAM-dependent methyltransferase [Polyangiaceae bacterium]|nr:class I SAM-dependent methyltransferase [Polyangiaceae bacterium]
MTSESLGESVDYFSNHRFKLRFPWRLYHQPIVRELSSALSASVGSEVLNLGSGPFFELAELPALSKRFTLCDIDPRALNLAREIHGEALAGTDVLTPGAALPYPTARFDAVVSMDVVEHLVDPLPWLEDALRVLKPGGLLFLTTPNYASRSLRVIENTALEAVARTQGFSRKDLHPSKLDSPSLLSLLSRAGAKNAVTKEIAFGWVLAAYAWR